MAVTAMQMLERGLKMSDKLYDKHIGCNYERRVDQYKRAFGSHPLVHACIFHDLQHHGIDHEGNVFYFLISQFFVMKYWTEKDLSEKFGLTEQTI